MARKATPRSAGGTAKKKTGRSGSSGSAGTRARSGGARSTASGARSAKLDPVDAVIKLLQSPLVIDLLAVGATAALAAITENRTGRGDGGAKSGKVMKAAGKAAAAAVGRRLASEFEEIRKASRTKKAKAGAAA